MTNILEIKRERLFAAMTREESDASLARAGAQDRYLPAHRLAWHQAFANVQCEEHWTTDNMDMVRAHAASLVASNPDIIVAMGGRVVPIFMRLCRSIPRVLPSASDPVGVAGM